MIRHLRLSFLIFKNICWHYRKTLVKLKGNGFWDIWKNQRIHQKKLNGVQKHEIGFMQSYFFYVMLVRMWQKAWEFKHICHHSSNQIKLKYWDSSIIVHIDGTWEALSYISLAAAAYAICWERPPSWKTRITLYLR